MKKILLSLFVGFVGIISFCSAINYAGKFTQTSYPVSQNSTKTFNFPINNSFICFRSSVNTNFSCDFNGLYNGSVPISQYVCLYDNGGSNETLTVNCTNNNSSSVYLYFFSMPITGCQACPTCPTCPTCQTCTGYNFSVFDNGSRIVNSPINTDINLYMQGSLFFTDLVSPDGDYIIESSCSTGNDCPVNTGNDCFSGNWSSLYINDIQHESSSNINITIPEEIAWDYERTDEDFDLNVSGYNVDTDYIAGIITTQNSKPSQGDLNKLVSEVLPLFIPGLAVILLLYFIFRFIKKVF